MSTHISQHDVTVRATYRRAELGSQAKPVPASRDFKVGSKRGALYFHLPEHALKFSFGGKYSSNAFEDAEISTLERITAGNRRLRNLVGSPWAQTPSSSHLARRLRVQKRDLEPHRAPAAEVLDGELVNGEPQRPFFWVAMGELEG